MLLFEPRISIQQLFCSAICILVDFFTPCLSDLFYFFNRFYEHLRFEFELQPTG